MPTPPLKSDVANGNISVEDFMSPTGETEEVKVSQTEEIESRSESEPESDSETEVDETEVEETDKKREERELREARELYRMLKDPSRATDAIRVMARNVGLLQDPPETKAEVKEAKKDITARLKERLGEFGFLAEKLGPAIDEFLGEIRAESKATASEQEARDVQNEVLRVSEKLNKETKGQFSRLESKMSQLANKILPSAEMTTEEYMRTLYTLATATSRVDPQTLARKIEQNRTNAPDRARTSTGREMPFDKNAKRTLKEAIRVAARSLSIEDGK